MQFLRLDPSPIHELGRIVHAIALFNRNLKNPADNAQCAVEARGAVILAVSIRPFIAVLPADSGDVSGIQFRPRFFQSRQNFPLVELGARLVIVVVLDFFSEHFNDDLTIDGLPLVDGQSAVVLEKIGELEFGNGQDKTCISSERRINLPLTRTRPK